MACLVTMLIAPPAVPRPSMVDDGPLRISICSVKKFSRMLTAGSRMPSTNTSLRASKPRMKKRSPKALPPSPVPMVIPGVVRQGLLEAGGVLVAQHLLRQHRDAARRVDDRLAEISAMPAGWPCRAPPDRRRDPAAPPAFSPRLPPAAWRAPRRRPSLRAMRRNALRARICSGEGLAAGGFGRAIGASTVTGGSDCSCASAPPMAATAIRQPTVTFCVELLSKTPSTLRNPGRTRSVSGRNTPPLIITPPHFLPRRSPTRRRGRKKR